MQGETTRHIPVTAILFVITCLVLAAPGMANAALRQNPAYAPMSVVISEVAWSGTAASPLDEWMELYNPGPVNIDLSGWTLAADDGTPSIALNHTIPAGGYYLLERTSDDVVSDIVADLVYSGDSLDDSGEYLHLRAPDGTDVDTANLADGAWPAGSGAPGFASMERLETSPDGPGAWESNDGITVNGLDANGDPLSGTPKRSNSVVPTLTPTFTSTFTTTFTATATPQAPTHLVISEFRSRGPNGVDDEFVELYNPTGGSVDISGWYVKRSASCSSIHPPTPTPVSTTLFTIASGSVLMPGQHYLAASSSHSSISGADKTFSPSLADDGGLALYNDSGSLIDQVGMCAQTQYREGTSLAPLGGTSNQSYERLPGGSTACYDTNNNSADFLLIPSANPQNLSSPVSLCLGVITLTPTVSRTPTLTRTSTPYVYQGVMAINEFLPHPGTDWNGDGISNNSDEYIEIINMGVDSINVKNWKLDNGGNGGSYTLPNLTLLSHQIVRFFASDTGISLSDGGGSVRLLKSNGETADSFNYPPVPASDQTWCRLPDGNGTWAFTCFPTPGKPNSVKPSTPVTPASNVSTSQSSLCRQPGSIYQSIWLVECAARVAGILEPALERRFWLPIGGKWDVFVE